MNESRTEKNLEISKKLDKEERDKKIKKITKKTLLIVIPIIVLISIMYILLKVVGNMGIVVREYRVYEDSLPTDFEGLKIIQFSDLHFNSNSSIKKINDLVNLINKSKPDIVLFTGDLIDKDYVVDNNTLETIQSEFNRINSSIGKYAIKGEEDDTLFKQVFDNSNFKILENNIERIYYKSSSIVLLNVNNTYSKENIQGIIDNDFVIGVIHEPDLTDRIINDFNPRIIMAGHSHNGQVRLPLIGPLMKKDGSKKYVSSYYKINNTELFISGGLGNSKYDFRLFNHPSINFYRLKKVK